MKTKTSHSWKRIQPKKESYREDKNDPGLWFMIFGVGILIGIMLAENFCK